MFEHRSDPLLTHYLFVLRIVWHIGLVLMLILIALFIGISGYHFLENLSWLDSLLNASMILGGMGPVDELHSTAGKLFASAYALFSGLLFVTVSGILAAPFIHRLMHRVHLDDGEQ